MHLGDSPNHKRNGTARVTRRIEGWTIVGVIFLGLLAFSAAVAWRYGMSADGLLTLVRGTARSSVVLFCLAFAASSLHRLRRRSWTAWLLRNRRYVGVSFAVSHGFHLMALVSLAVRFPHPYPG